MPDLDPRTILDTPMADNDAGASTIRGYLVALLAAVWDRHEYFSGKYAFGNSGWHWDLYAALIKAGHIPGRFDEYGDVEDADRPAGDRLIAAAIQALGAPVEDDDRHIIDVTENGWTIKHPLSCRPNLFDCPVNKAATRDLTEASAELGRFACDVDDDGHFTIGQRVEEADRA